MDKRPKTPGQVRMSLWHNSFIEPPAAFAGDEQHNQNHEHIT
jgi:hypothetical protein